MQVGQGVWGRTGHKTVTVPLKEGAPPHGEPFGTLGGCIMYIVAFFN